MPRRDEFWNDQRSWDDTNDLQRTRSHRQITRGSRIIPALHPTDPTPTSQSRMFDYENDDPDYSTGTVRPTSTGTPSGGYAWEVGSADDFGIDDGSETAPDESGEFGLGTYSGLAAGGPAAPIDDEYDHPEVGLADRPRRVFVDPLLMRLGIIIAVAVIAVPFAVGLGGGGSNAEGSEEIDAADTEAEETPDTEAEPADTGRATTRTKNPTKTPTKAKQREATSTTAAAAASNDSDDSDGSEGPGSHGENSQQASLGAEPDVACGQQYEVIAGDYWTRLSDASGASLDNLLAANSATLDTPLYPGEVICLSQGAIRQPAPPTTTTAAPPTTKVPTTTTEAPEKLKAPSTTEAPSTTKATSPPTTVAPTTAAPTTAAPKTAAPTTAAPTTTQAPPPPPPTTQAPPPPPPPTTAPPARPGSVQDIIRSVWPDDLEERALVISYRESTWIPTAENYCCVGLFQIYYDVHKDWLRDVGVHQKSDLYDPYLNSLAAYTLYQRSGGWGPWAQTNY